MKLRQRVLAIVMAGGEGTRLMPLTAERSKPSVPFASRYRIVDFVLSNLVNSGIHAIYLLVQYKSQSLIEHVRRAWVLPPILPEHFVTVVPPQMRTGPEWFQGTADAVFQNLNLIRQFRPDLVLVFGADHIYRMNVRQMVQFHVDCRAQATVAALRVPRDKASHFGVIQADENHCISAFLEKPVHPPAIPGEPGYAYASMGNYIFDTAVLLDALHSCRSQGGTDFGKDVLPGLAGGCRLYAYDFALNRVPGVQDYEEPAYWRDVGSLDTYFDANMDVLGAQPRFDLFNARWPVYSSNYQGPAARFIDAHIHDSMVSAGCLVNGASLRSSVLRREVTIERGAELEDCIIMDNVTIGAGARLRHAIVDRFNLIPAGSQIGFDPAGDRERFRVTESGIVVVGPAPDVDTPSYGDTH